MELDLYLDVFT